MNQLNQEAVKGTVFETLRIRKRLIKLNKYLSCIVDAKGFDYERYRDVLEDYQTLQDEYSEVLQKIRIVKPQIEVDSTVSLTPIVDQIHSQNYNLPYGTVILKALEQLENMTQHLILDFDAQCQENIERIIAKRQ